MPKLPCISGKELIKALQKDGFKISRQRGSHVQLVKIVNGEKNTFPVPVHASKDLKTGTLRGILRKAGISIERLIELL